MCTFGSFASTPVTDWGLTKCSTQVYTIGSMETVNVSKALKRVCIFFCFFGSITLSLSADSLTEVMDFTPWEKYDQFTYSDFKNYGPANQPIEFGNIDYALLNAAIFYETNRRRSEKGLFPYKHSDALERAAFMHAIDMVRGGFFNHSNTRDAKKRSPSDRSALFGGGAAGENIATTFGIQYEAGTMVSDINAIPPHSYNSFAEALVDGWMHSPGHRANILDEYGIGYEYLGCGGFENVNDAWHKFNAVQNFSASGAGAGKPAASAPGSDGSRQARAVPERIR